MKEATAQGFRLEVHAIGDAAAEMVIKAMEGAGVVQEKRPILTHCQASCPILCFYTGDLMEFLSKNEFFFQVLDTCLGGALGVNVSCLLEQQVLRRDLLPRMKALGMIANVQPQFVPTDARWIDQFLPDDLMQLVYPWKTLTDAGSCLLYWLR